MACPHKNAYNSFAYLATFVAVVLTVSGIDRPNVKISFPDIADYDYQNESLAIVTNSDPIFELICYADYPVEWIFYYSLEDDGISEQTKLATTYRNVSNFTDVASYKYTAKLRLEYKGKLFSLANFTCRPAERDRDSRTDLMSHVIMSEKDKMSLIILRATSKPPEKPHPDLKVAKNCSRAVAVMGREPGPGGFLPCNKCEFPGTGKKLELDYLRCLTPIECASTYSRRNKGTGCLQRLSFQPPECKEVVPHFNPTILVCKNYGPALAQFYFYGVFRTNGGEKVPDKVPIYYNWEDVNPTKMLYMHHFQKKILYTGELAAFTCEYSRYYFSLGSWFGIKNHYGTEYIKATDKKPCDTSVEKDLRTDNCTLEAWRGTYTSSKNMSFSQVGRHEVFCFGPVWNSTKWINASVSFHVEKSESPQVVSVQPDNNKEFVVGQVNRKLICKVSGKPIPKISWTGPSNESMHPKQVDNFTSEIIFVEIGLKTSGKYICSATSYVGSHHKFFQLTSHKGSSLSGTAIAAISVSVIILATIITLAMLRMCRVITAQRHALRLLTEAELNEFVQGNPHILEAHRNHFLNNATAIEALPYDEKYEIPNENLFIEFSKILGSGEYGLVVKGKVLSSSVSHYANLADAHTAQEYVEVAVKVSKGNLNVTNFKALLTEIKVMAYLGAHKNIASLVGACTKNIQNRELYIAVEYCHNGSLDKFLKEHKSEFAKSGEQGQFTVRNLLQWSMDIAEGVEYIHGKKIIHGDLAIRNILLSKDLVAKVGDFGLSRQLTESSSYTKTTKCALPWRSMAIESLRSMEFSVKSDMWAFGVTLWEVFTLGDTPYPGMTYTIEFTSILEGGLRLYKPPLASNAIYDYMLMCWSIEPNDRPGTNDFKVTCLREMN